MAVFRAIHRASGSQGSSYSAANLPSIFDVLSQESLRSSLKPALQSLVKFLAQWYPQRFRFFCDFYDEFYAVFLLLLENYYLKHYSASFAENFYNMKRVLSFDRKKLFPFRHWHTRLKSLILLVIVPYLADKIDKFMRRLKYSGQRSNVSFLLRIYSYMLSIVRAASIAVQVLYAFRDFTSAFSFESPTLPHWLANIVLERLTADDMNSFSSVPLHHQGSGILARLWRLVLSATSLTGRLFSYGIFCLQFFEYFYANDLTRQLSILADTGDFTLPTTPVHPRKVIQSENYVLTSMEAGRCPLCYGTRVNDTALTVSGYVFCYECIDDYIAHEGRCPLTGLPATTDQLVRLYVRA